MAWYEIENAADVTSPSLLIFEARVQANLERMVRMAGNAARLRPHVKTHKLPQIVAMSLELGIRRFKCATLAEAEMCARADAPDVLFAYQPVGPNVAGLRLLVDAYPETRFSCLVDDLDAARALSATFADAATPLPVYLDLDVGMGRTGVADATRAAPLYAELGRLPGIALAGLHAYDGHVHASALDARKREADAAFQIADAIRNVLRQAGFAVPSLVLGGTPSFPIHAARPDVELSPGTCVLWDYGYTSHFPDLDFFPAALVLTRVVSKPGAGLLCLDLGYKAICSEQPQPRAHFLGLGPVRFVTHSEEHLVIESARAAELPVGSALYAVPWHICPTVALYDEAVVVRGTRADERWPITARGRSLGR